MDNVIAALGKSNRVCQVNLWGSRLGNVLPLMQVPFPELTDLRLTSRDRDNIPDTFLGGSAPRLRSLILNFVSFPGLPKLLLSATHLVHLHLMCIPHSGYISPEAIVPPLSMLSNLKSLNLQFKSLWSDEERSSLPPPNRLILSALADLYFEGPLQYFEELVSHIDTPQLDTACIEFSPRFEFNFDCPQLIHFINRTPTLRALEEAHVLFHDYTASLRFQYRTSKPSWYQPPIGISCYAPAHLQFWAIEPVCNPSLHLLSTVEDLYIEHQVNWTNVAIGNVLWLELLLPFTMVKNLYLFEKIAPGIAAALQELVGDRITEVLPNLQHIFVEELEPSGPFQENIGRFVAARRHTSHSIAISVWDENTNMKST